MRDHTCHLPSPRPGRFVYLTRLSALVAVGAALGLAAGGCDGDTAGSSGDAVTATTDANGAGPSDAAASLTPDALSPDVLTSAADVQGPGPDAGPPTPDVPVTPGGGAVGAPCVGDSDCAGVGAICLDLPGGYCAIGGCTAGTCPAGSACYTFQSGDANCIQTCGGNGECRVGEGYICDTDGTCWPGEGTPTGASPIGGPCAGAGDCADPGATCYGGGSGSSPTGFYDGYCMLFDCQVGSCPAGSKCISVSSDGTTACFADCSGGACPQAAGYVCSSQSQTCWPGCGSDQDCPAGAGCMADVGCVPGWSNEPFECTDQTFEPNETAGVGTALQAPGSWDGLQICEGDEDWFEIAVPAGHIGTLGATFSNIQGDLDLLAYTTAGTFLGARLGSENYGGAARSNESNYEYLSIMNQNGTGTARFRMRGYSGAANTYALELFTTPWVDGLLCTDHYDFDHCRGYDGTKKGELIQVPFARADDPYVPDGYIFDSYGSYRWLRRELAMLVRYAIHEVQQKFPNTGPLGLIDMCDKDGITPGYDVGDPRHPETTHDQGGNIDIAYYQTDGSSSADVVCGPNGSASDGYFCTSIANHVMDVPRTTYYMAMLARHPRLRVIGVDKLLAPLIIEEAGRQKGLGWISQKTRDTLVNSLAYGDGWPFHHHHMHVSMRWWHDDASPNFSAQVLLPQPADGCSFRMPGDGEAR